jgi:hypothetical protein
LHFNFLQVQMYYWDQLVQMSFRTFTARGEVLAPFQRSHDTQQNNIQHNDIRHNDTQHNNKIRVTIIMLSIIALDTDMLSVANKPKMLSVVMLIVVMLNVVMLNVVAPCKRYAKVSSSSLCDSIIVSKKKRIRQKRNSDFDNKQISKEETNKQTRCFTNLQIHGHPSK